MTLEGELGLYELYLIFLSTPFIELVQPWNVVTESVWLGWWVGERLIREQAVGPAGKHIKTSCFCMCSGIWRMAFKSWKHSLGRGCTSKETASRDTKCRQIAEG